MEKLKYEPGEPEKKKEPTAQVEFVAPYPLEDCVLRIRDTKSLDKGFMSPGFDPSYEKVEPGVYRFKIRRTWYDQRYRRQSSMVELNGYLKGIDETSTVVIAQTRISLSAMIVMVLIVVLLVASAFAAPNKSGGLIFVVGAGIILPFYFLMIWWDRRSLLRAIHRAMRDDL